MSPFLLFLSFLVPCHLLSTITTYAIPAGPHINNLNILLPPRTTFPVRYRLQGSDGCFTWAWDHHDILSVEPEYNETGDCSTSATVTSIASFVGRRSTAVYATDTLTGLVIRCEVFLDAISRIQIFHHSVKLDLDGLATLRIRAFDSEDNVFSSLVGLQFKWELVPMGSFEEGQLHSLVHVLLKDTPLSDCGCVCGDIDTQIELEQMGVGSDLFVVRGLAVGQEKVVVNISEPRLENLGDEIVLTVAEAMFLEPPSPLYIILGTRVQYCLKTLHHNLPSEVKLPSPYHRWSVHNSSVASFDSFSGLVLGRMVGSTNVLVEDIRVAGHQQISSLHVVLPDRLRLHLTPLLMKGTNQRDVSKRQSSIVSSDMPWYLIKGWDYVVQVLVFSQESGIQPLYITKDNNLELIFGEWPYWNTVPIPDDVAREQGWHNATLLKATTEGRGKIFATLRYSNLILAATSSESIGYDEQVLTIQQEVIVCSSVVVKSENNEELNQLILPWSFKYGQDYQLIASGGCGEKYTDYRWTSSDPAVAVVSSVGVLQTEGFGKAFIRVATFANLLNFAEVIVDVSGPSSIIMVEDLPVEVEVGSILPVAISLRSSDGFLYSKCSIFYTLVHWKAVSGDGVLTLVNDTATVDFSNSLLISPVICAWAFFIASLPGQATVTAALNLENWAGVSSPTPNILPLLEVSWIVATYLPLRLTQVGDEESYDGYGYDVSPLESASIDLPSRHHVDLEQLLLVPGSSMKVMLRGGPERWSPTVDFLEWHDIISLTNKATSIEDISVVHVTGAGGRFYEITCKAIGNYTVTFHRGNSIGEGHPRPEIAKVKLSLTCDVPFMIILLVDEPENAWDQIKALFTAIHDSGVVHTTPVTVVNARTIRVGALALDKSMNLFANASSLALNWVLEGCQELAHWEEVAENGANHPYGSWNRKLVLEQTTGQCIVKASVAFLADYRLLTPSVKLAALTMLEQREQFLSHAVLLELVASLRIEPKSALLFFHPSAKASFAVVGGTGSIEFHMNDSRVAIVLQQFPISPFLHLTVAPRDLGTAMITVQDRGLTTSVIDTALVRVADVSWVRMLLPEEARIALGSILTVKLQAGDIIGNVFEDSQMEFMNIRIHLEDDILELVNKEGIAKPSGTHISGSTFLLRGSSVGVTSNLYVSTLPITGREILSDFVRVEVYAPLSLHPTDLVLAPGSKFVVWVEGGPSTNIAVRFSTADDKIASIDRTSGLLVVNGIGDVMIFGEAFDHQGHLVCETSMKLIIIIPSAMLLNVRGGQLGVGQEMSIFPMAKEGDLFVFFELCGDYKWTIEDEQVMLLKYPGNSVDILPHYARCDEHEHPVLSTSVFKGRAVDPRFSARVLGRASGKTDVTVSFTCYFQSMHGEPSTSPIFYKASDIINVLSYPPLALGVAATWLLPPHFVSSMLLPQTDMFEKSRVVGNRRHLSYSILHEGCAEMGGITLDNGHIKTSERNDLACIQANDLRTGRSEIAACVRVAEVAYITVGEKGPPFHIVDLSIGTHHLENITFRDYLGTPFLEVGNAVQLVISNNHVDVLSAKILDRDDGGYQRRPSIILKALRQGTALVRISQEGNPLSTDYILVNVGAYIFPRNPVLHMGDRVNFSIVGKGVSSSDEGQWLSTNETVIQIDRDIGEAVAAGPGKAVVHFNGSRFATYTSATVVQVTAISVKAPSRIVTNVPYPDQGYQFPVEFRHPQDSDMDVIGTSADVTYKCLVVPTFIGHSSPWRDPDSGAYYCMFFPYAPERLFWNQQRQVGDVNAIQTFGDAKGVLHVTVIAEVSGVPEFGSAEAVFVGGFSILDHQDQLYLVNALNKTRLTVVGSVGAIEISWPMKDVMNVRRITNERDAFGVGGHAVYEVTICQEAKPFKDKLVFSLPTTGQQEDINVTYVGEPIGAVSLYWQIAMAAIVTLVLLVIPFLICARLLDLPHPFKVLHERQVTLTNPGLDENSDATPVRANRTPSPDVRTPQHLSSSRSPPQPYTEYVSKTIENTPYFRRQSVRPFDPSRTY